MSADTDLRPNADPMPRPRSRLRRRLALFRRKDDGAAAVEFALVAMPFFALLFAILETALTFWSTQVLETAVANASRRLYTGQFQQGNDQAAADISAKFKDEVCKHVPALFACTRDSAFLHVDVRKFTPGSSPPDMLKDKQVEASSFGYQPTKANEIVMVRVALEYPVFVSMLNSNVPNLANGKRLLVSTATFRNEPF
jgi:Flp pilus assembly protein TadG